MQGSLGDTTAGFPKQTARLRPCYASAGPANNPRIDPIMQPERVRTFTSVTKMAHPTKRRHEVDDLEGS